MRFPWQKSKLSEPNAAKARALVVPKTYRFQVSYNVTENNLTVNSYSTHIVTLMRLEEGKTAQDIASSSTGTVNFGGTFCSNEEGGGQNLQRIQFDAPNWIGVIVCSDGMVYFENVDLPVWADIRTGEILCVDVDALLLEMEPHKQRASEIWGETEGPFATYFQLRNAPREILKTGKELASLPGTWIGAIKDMVDDMKGEGKPPEPIPDHMKPDLSKYAPAHGLDYETWVLLSARPEKIQEMGVSQYQWAQGNEEWMARTMKDWRLGAQYGNDIERIRKTRS